MKRFLSVCCIILSISLQAQQPCDYSGRYYDFIFDKITRHANILYATKPTSLGVMDELYYDVYEPEGDTAAIRSAIIMVHGGAYLELLDQRSPDILKFTDEMVRRGYVVVSIDYRQEKNFNALLSDEKMIKAVARSLVDIHDAVCHIMNDIKNGNPYRMDTNNVVACGVSAGAISLLHGAFMDSISDLPGIYPQWIYEVIGPEAQSILDDRYCGGKLKGLVNISGALLNSDWVANDTSLALFNIHGFQNPIVPFKKGYPLQIPSLPQLEGSYYIHQKALALGMKSYSHYYNKGHAPIFDVDLNDIFSGNLIDILFNDWILKQTQEDMRDFYYKILNHCSNDVSTPLYSNENIPLSLFPNPTSDRLYINMPSSLFSQNVIVNFFTLTGENILQVPLQNSKAIDVRQQLSPGMYIVQILGEDENNYVGKITIQ